MNKRGYDIERGEPSELQHKSVHEFKKEERQKELNNLDQQLIFKEKEIQRMDNLRNLKEEGLVDIRSDQSIEELCRKSVEIEVSKGMLGSKVKVEEADFHCVVDLAKELQEKLAAEHKRTNALSQEVGKMMKENKVLTQQLESVREDLSMHLVHQDREIEKAKHLMRQKLIRDFSANEKEKLKEEVKRELDSEYKAHISSLSDDLTIENQKHEKTKRELVQANKANDTLTKMNVDYIENYVPKEDLDKANQQVNELKKENKTLKAWKEKALNWIDKNVEKMKQISFFQHVGGVQKRNKRQDQEIER